MKTIKGKYAEAKVFTDDIEDYAEAQIKTILSSGMSEGSVVRIMPDVHPGKVGPIGLTMTIRDKIMPQILGIDIGCGMLLAEVDAGNIEFNRLDKVIRENIPAGFNIRKTPHLKAPENITEELYCSRKIDTGKAMRSLGTLGGGNHFIEIEKCDGKTYVMIHTGSRHLGKEVTDYYMDKSRKEGVPYELTCLEGDLMRCYLHDIEVTTRYASLNREIILHEILKGMKWKVRNKLSCCHNYASVLPDGSMILRKGAISALKGEDVIIPVNMRDGVIIGKGKGDPDWNYSAPHGSGRRIRRDEVKNRLTVSAYKASVKGIFSSSVGSSTLDEAPEAYRCLDDILMNINASVEVKSILRPVYNFKAGGKD